MDDSKPALGGGKTKKRVVKPMVIKTINTADGKAKCSAKLRSDNITGGIKVFFIQTIQFRCRDCVCGRGDIRSVVPVLVDCGEKGHKSYQEK